MFNLIRYIKSTARVDVIAIAMFVIIVNLATATPAQSQTLGHERCADFEGTEKAYQDMQNLDLQPHKTMTKKEKMDTSLTYAICLLVKGQVTNNQNQVVLGMGILHSLSDDFGNLVASDYIATYHYTDGTFGVLSNTDLDIAAGYWSKTLAIIKLFRHYPPPIYEEWEERRAIEMWVYAYLPQVYLRMSFLGVTGDYNHKKINSSDYKGDRDLPMYSAYDQNIMGYINLAIEHAVTCSRLPRKAHFTQDVFPYVKKACGLYEKKARQLKTLQEQRWGLSSQDKCRDLADCPEMSALSEEFIDTYRSIVEERARIYEPVASQVFLYAEGY